MAFISESRHREFLDILDRSLIGFEEQNAEDITSQTIAINLKKEKTKLQDLYSECNNKTEELRKLIALYQQLQQKTRSELRVFRQRCRQK